MFYKSRFCQGVLAVIVASSLASCSPRIGYAEHGAHDATASAREHGASVFEKDSARVEIRFFQVRDTFFRDSIVIRWRTKIVHDTVMIRDSIFHCDTVRVVEYVDRATWFDKVTNKIGGISLLLLVLIFLYQILKFRQHD
jgi:hypothetical protein